MGQFSLNNSPASCTEEVRDYIYSIDFSKIINKMVSIEKWKLSDAKQACELYRNFLFLNFKYADESPLPPSEEIDNFWHNHILDTEKYNEDCKVIFGKYFHHYPYLGIDGKTSMVDLCRFFKKTQELHNKEFGCYILPVRLNWFQRLISKILRCDDKLKIRERVPLETT